MTETTIESRPEMPHDSNNLVEIENLSAGYAGVAVIRGVNLTVAKGEVVALLGPNGAGKTTTLLTTSGLLKTLEGKVTVLGESAWPSRSSRLFRTVETLRNPRVRWTGPNASTCRVRRSFSPRDRHDR